MKKVIIVRSAEDLLINETADAFTEHSAGVAICDRNELSDVISSYGADAVFSFGFDDDISDICKKRDLSAVFWIYEIPAPELFLPALFNENNRIFIPDADLFEILKSTGFPHIYSGGKGAGLKRWKNDVKQAELISDRLMLHLEDDEKNFLRGVLRAQEVCPEMNVIFRALGSELVTKLYSYAGFSDSDVLLKKRYVVSECILKTTVIKDREGKDRFYYERKDLEGAVSEIMKIV